MRKSCAVLLAAFLLAACGADSRRQANSAGDAGTDAGANADTALGPPQFAWFAFNVDVGTAAIDTATGELCFSSPNAALGKDEKVWLVEPSADPQRVAQARVSRGASECVMSDAGRGERGYLLTDFTGSADSTAVMIALTHPIGLPAVVGSKALADIDGDQRVESFHACTSGEGVHLSIWSAPTDTTLPPPRDGSPPGDRRWHRFHNLGQDVENTCTPGETR